MRADVPDPEKKRSNNGPEAFRRHLNSMFYTSHPNIHFFVDNLQKIQANTYIRLRQLDRPVLIRKALAKQMKWAVQARTDFESNLISLSEYMLRLGRRFQAIKM